MSRNRNSVKRARSWSKDISGDTATVQSTLIDVLSTPLKRKTKQVFSNSVEETQIKVLEDRNFLRAWLRSLQLEHYEEVLVERGIVSISSLSKMDEDALKKLGINTLGARKKILQSLSDFTCYVREKDDNSSVSEEQTASKNTNSVVPTEQKLYPIFYTMNNTNYKKAENQQTFRKNRGHPFTKTVPGTSFTVDSFKAAGEGDCRQFFLSHFHSDHTVGLTSSFQAGVIFTSPTTAALIRSQLGVKEEYIKVLEVNQSCYIPDEGKSSHGTTGATVTLIDANHCPGSVMFLFFVWHTNELILHTGDFRYSVELHSCIPHLFGRTSLDYLFLDTTYCDPRYDFPSQQEAVEAVVEAVKAESFYPRVLFLFGTYQIGKEKVFLQVAESLNEKVYVDKRKYRILSHLSLPEHIQGLLTTEACASRLHVVDMRSVSFSGMKEISQKYATRYDTFVGFRPTGWSYTGQKMTQPYGNLKPGILTRQLRQNCVLYGVPYSEHSSFSELKEFVSVCRPKNLVPTVCSHRKNSKDEADRMRQWLWCGEKKKVVAPRRERD
ncbi:hypothetical protein GAYE_SCF64G6742 [Galdieria yellowstonensis]|uniref:SAM domain-containing protein n=1 Tax=Galdieria yellowstonensis TaxID=3028027 RepID=A0AAV9INR2_9RHOD|nr:hypothetical protein GAYE_SCF64G6742 [Galdieria yellowstonensis]